MSTSHRARAAGAHTANGWLLWSGVAAAIVCGLALAASFVGEPALETRERATAELQLRVRQIRSDALSLYADQPDAELVSRFTAQLQRTKQAFESYQSDAVPWAPEPLPPLASSWLESDAVWSDQLISAQRRLDDVALKRSVLGKLREASAVVLSLARTAMTQPDVSPALRVRWLQLPITLADIRERLLQSVLSAELSAPFADAAADVSGLIEALDTPAWTRQTRQSLQAVETALSDAAATIGAVDDAYAAPIGRGERDAITSSLEQVLAQEMAAIARVHRHWVSLRYAAFAAGVIALLCLAVAAVSACATLARLPPEMASRYGRTLRRLSAESKRDNSVSRSLLRACRERFLELKRIGSDTQKVVQVIERVGRQSAVIEQAGEECLSSHRKLANQLATARARMIATQQQALQWAERNVESAALAESIKQLGEHAALLQVNARIRVGSADAGIAEDFHRLNESVVRAREKVDALVRRQGDASERALDSLSGALQALSQSEQSMVKSNAQFGAVVSGQRELSRRNTVLEEKLNEQMTAVHVLQARLHSDLAVAQRLIKAGQPKAEADSPGASRRPPRTAPVPAPARDAESEQFVEVGS